MTKQVIIYTDGACRGNPGPGGWGVLLLWGEEKKELYGFEADTTNNRMELRAAIQALMALQTTCHVTLYTDSQYVKKGISEWIFNWKKKGWRTASGKAVKNADLWQQLDTLSAKHQIEWCWVKGHSGHPENDYVDALANRAIDEMENS